MHNEDRRKFVKTSLATSMTFTFAGLIRAHGEEGGGTTTWNPEESTAETTDSGGTTTWNPDGSTVETSDGGNTTTWNPDESTAETTWNPDETTGETTAQETTAKEKETKEVPVEATVKKVTIEKYFVATRTGQSGMDDSQLILQDSSTQYQSVNGSNPPPPPVPEPPPGDGWAFKNWKEKPEEIAAKFPTLPVSASGTPTWTDLPDDNNPGINLPNGYQWSSKVRQKKITGTISYEMTAIFERDKP